MSMERGKTMHDIRRDLIETMRRIEENGRHQMLLNPHWVHILATHPPAAVEEEAEVRKEKKQEEVPINSTTDNNDDEKEKGSFDHFQPFLSPGPSHICLAPSAISIDVKDPEKVASFISNLKELSQMCRSFESVLSGVLPISETCVAMKSKEKEAEEKKNENIDYSSLLDFIHELKRELSRSVSKASVVSSTSSWISWLPKPFVEHLDGSLTKSEPSIIAKPESSILDSKSLTELGTSFSTMPTTTTSRPTLCDCNICGYVNDYAYTAKNWMEKMVAESSEMIFPRDVDVEPKTSMSSHGLSTTSTSSTITTASTHQSLTDSTMEKRNLKKRHLEVPSSIYCISPMSCTEWGSQVAKKRICSSPDMPAAEKTSAARMTSSCSSWFTPEFEKCHCTACSTITMTTVTPVSSKASTDMSGYVADSEVTSTSNSSLPLVVDSVHSLLGLIPPVSTSIVNSVNYLPVQAITPAMVSAATPTIEAISHLLAVEAPTTQTIEQARRFIQHKKALWTLLFIVCDTGIRVADEALRELDGDC